VKIQAGLKQALKGYKTVNFAAMLML